MCRLMAYIGPPVLVADVVLWPDRRYLSPLKCRAFMNSGSLCTSLAACSSGDTLSSAAN